MAREREEERGGQRIGEGGDTKSNLVLNWGSDCQEMRGPTGRQRWRKSSLMAVANEQNCKKGGLGWNCVCFLLQFAVHTHYTHTLSMYIHLAVAAAAPHLSKRNMETSPTTMRGLQQLPPGGTAWADRRSPPSPQEKTRTQLARRQKPGKNLISLSGDMQQTAFAAHIM